ncbi:MAG: DUF6576 domain-containing protein, partial [Verrucomicrobiota bacterium]
PITIKAWMLAAGFGLLHFLLLIGGAGGNVAYSVHVGGIVSGCIYALIVFRPEVISSILHRFSRRPRHLKIMKPPEEDFSATSQDIDVILDKIAEKGMSSLSRKEKAILEKASKERRGER